MLSLNITAKDKAIADRKEAKVRTADSAAAVKVMGVRKDKALKAEAEASKALAASIEALDHAREIEQPTIKAYMADAADKVDTADTAQTDTF